MAHFTYDFNPVTYIVADATGEPGQRTFFLQARQGSQLVSLVMEKQQVSALATSAIQLLEELESQNPDLPPAVREKRPLRLESPVSPAFRVGQLGLGYDEELDMIVVVAQAMSPTADVDDETPEAEADAEGPMARFYATRSQIRTLCEHALTVVQAGRPECPLCGRAIDPQGHFCPRTNGHAHPLMV